MAQSNLNEQFAELKGRFEKLPEERRSQAMKAFMDAITLCELPAAPEEAFEISVSLKRDSEVTYRSG